MMLFAALGQPNIVVLKLWSVSIVRMLLGWCVWGE